MLPIQLELPEHFLEEEVRSGYTVTARMKKVWAVELDLLHELLRVCEKYGIRIFAADGTLLGAVRHGGFIPWDDDVDVMMLRDEYNRLCGVAEKEFRHPYFFQTEYTDPGSLRGHAQLRNSCTTGILVTEAPQKCPFNQGIFIDIFPVDNISDDEKAVRKQERLRKRYLNRARRIAGVTLRYRADAMRGAKGYVKKVLHRVFTVLDPDNELERRAYRKFESVCVKYNGTATEYTSVLAFPLAKKRYRKRAAFEERTYMQFEFLTVPVFRNYDEFLTNLYGEYRIPVRGTSLHGELILDPEKPYTEYIA